MAGLKDVPAVIPTVVPAKSTGDCRTCGAADPRYGAPGCTACGWRRAAAAGRAPIALAHELMDSRQRRRLSPLSSLDLVLTALRDDTLRPGRFYLWSDSGADLVRALAGATYRTVEDADAAARALTADHDGVWVVSVTGLWQVRSGDAALR